MLIYFDDRAGKIQVQAADVCGMRPETRNMPRAKGEVCRHLRPTLLRALSRLEEGISPETAVFDSACPSDVRWMLTFFIMADQAPDAE